jgi:hypothetical protein
MSTKFRHRSRATLSLGTLGFFGLFGLLGAFGLSGVGHPGDGGALLGGRRAEAREGLDGPAQKQVAAAVEKGRKLAAQGKYAESITAFQSAIASSPTAASALSELGLAYYHLKQYAEAEAALHRALKATSAPAQRGRSLYNLGLILEAKGDTRAAVAAYKDSLAARSNQVVLERLRKLDAAAAAALDPVAPRSFRGPFATLKDTCAALNDCQKRAAAELSVAGPNYSCRSKKPVATLPKPAAPYRAVQLIAAVCAEGKKDTGDSDSRVYLVVQGEKGWFATDVGGKIESEQLRTFTDFAVGELRLTAGPAPRLLLRVKESGGHDVGEGSDSWENEKLVIAGIGPSGTPSATPPLLISSRETEDPGAAEATESAESAEASDQGAKPIVRVDAKLKFDLQGDVLELTPASAAKAVARARLAPVGKYTLVFK